MEFWHDNENCNIPLTTLRRKVDGIPNTSPNIHQDSGYFFILESALELLDRARPGPLLPGEAATVYSSSHGTPLVCVQIQDQDW